VKPPAGQLREVLAEAGIFDQDVEARALVDQVNARLGERGSGLRYAVTLVATADRAGWPSETPRELPAIRWNGLKVPELVQLPTSAGVVVEVDDYPRVLSLQVVAEVVVQPLIWSDHRI